MKIKTIPMKKLIFISILSVIVLKTESVEAQYASKKVKSKHEAYTDSLKNVEYDYIFPILGQGAYSKGFDIPYPAGLMGNYMWMEQNITLENFQLGLLSDEHDIPLTDVDFIDFEDNVNTSYSINVRPDLWILPFLNVYGIFGWGQSRTEVNIVKPINFTSIVEQDLRTAGVGIMGAGGVGPVWLSADFNMTWSKPELLDEAVRVTVLGLRLGKTFKFNNRPQSNLAIWAGAMYMSMSTVTQGQIQLIDALPPDVWERKDELVNDYYNWYENEATPGQKIIADQVLTPIVERIDDADGSSIIRYGMDKQVEQKWNGTLGMQYQLNKRWMFRSEAGFIGNRKSILFSLNYRFLI